MTEEHKHTFDHSKWVWNEVPETQRVRLVNRCLECKQLQAYSMSKERFAALLNELADRTVEALERELLYGKRGENNGKNQNNVQYGKDC